MRKGKVYQVCTPLGRVLKETVSLKSATLFAEKMMESPDCPCILHVEVCEIL